MRTLVCLFFALAAAGCGSRAKTAAVTPPLAPPIPTTIEEAVASEYRSAENRTRDIYRHPVETLKFFGVEPNMTVVEIAPGAGWYMEILAPFIAPNGKYYAAVPPDSAGSYMPRLRAKINDWLAKYPELQAKVNLTVFDPKSGAEIAPEGTVDRVLTFRNVHGWVSNGSEREAFAAFYKALKPGGVLGVVEHRISPKGKYDATVKSGYMSEDHVIRLAKAAGFKLDARSEINKNPKDNGNHPNGVWSLPPSLRGGEENREAFLAIGESDRMTLRFVKPAK